MHQILMKLKKTGKFVFLTTNRSLTFSRLCLEVALGEHWGEVFSLILADCKKPLWASYHKAFQEVDPLTLEKTGTKFRTAKSLREAFECGTDMLNEGNIALLGAFLKEKCGEDARVAYISADIFGDIMSLSKCFAVKNTWHCILDLATGKTK
jgi:hypothetical protein